MGGPAAAGESGEGEEALRVADDEGVEEEEEEEKLDEDVKVWSTLID